MSGLTELLSNFENTFKSSLHTCIPCKIEAVKDDRVDVRPVYQGVKIGNKRQIQIETGEEVIIEDYKLPLVINCPLVMLVNSVARITIPCDIGDTGLLIISERDINNWRDGKGEILDSLRKFNINDGFFLPFVNQKITDYSNNSIQIEYKNSRIELKDGDIDIVGDLKITGDLDITGDVEITGDTTIGGISFAMHTHNVVAIGSPTGPPQ